MAFRRALPIIAALLVAPVAVRAQSALPAVVGGQAPRLIARYDFRPATPGVELPRTVALSDSAGTLVAVAEGAGRVPMTVSVLDGDVVLQGKTAAGLLTLVLNRANLAPAGPLRGIWTLGEAVGTLAQADRR
jgi:hypothetical protein